MPETRMFTDFSGGIRLDVPSTAVNVKECVDQVNVVSEPIGALTPRKGCGGLLYDDEKGFEFYGLGTYDSASGTDTVRVVDAMIWYQGELIVGCAGLPDGTRDRGAGLYKMSTRADGRRELVVIGAGTTIGTIGSLDPWVLDNTQPRNQRYLQEFPRKWSFSIMGNYLYCFTGTNESLVYDGSSLRRLNPGYFDHIVKPGKVQPYLGHEYDGQQGYDGNLYGYDPSSGRFEPVLFSPMTGDRITSPRIRLFEHRTNTTTNGPHFHYRAIPGKLSKDVQYQVVPVTPLAEGPSIHESVKIDPKNFPLDIYDIGAEALCVTDRLPATRELPATTYDHLDKRKQLVGVVAGSHISVHIPYQMDIDEAYAGNLQEGQVINHYKWDGTYWSREPFYDAGGNPYVAAKIQTLTPHVGFVRLTFKTEDGVTDLTTTWSNDPYPAGTSVATKVAYRFDTRELSLVVLQTQPTFIYPAIVRDALVGMAVTIYMGGKTFVRKIVSNSEILADVGEWNQQDSWGFVDQGPVFYLGLDATLPGVKGDDFETNWPAVEAIQIETFSRIADSIPVVANTEAAFGLTPGSYERWYINDDEEPEAIAGTILSMRFDISRGHPRVGLPLNTNHRSYVYETRDGTKTGGDKPDMTGAHIYRSYDGEPFYQIDRLDLQESPASAARGDVIPPIWRDRIGPTKQGTELGDNSAPLPIYGSTVWKNRLWGFDGEWLYWSEAGRPANWPRLNAMEFPQGIVGVHALRETEVASQDMAGIVILTKSGVYGLRETEAGFVPHVLDNTVRCVGLKAACSYAGNVYFMTDQGPMRVIPTRLSGLQVERIGSKLQTIFFGPDAATVGSAQEEAVCGYDPVRNEVIWSLDYSRQQESASTTSTLNGTDRVLAFHIPTESWRWHQFILGDDTDGDKGPKGFSAVCDDGQDCFFACNWFSEATYSERNKGNIFLANRGRKDGFTYIEVTYQEYVKDPLGTYYYDPADQQFKLAGSGDTYIDNGTASGYLLEGVDGNEYDAYWESGDISMPDGTLMSMDKIFFRGAHGKGGLTLQVWPNEKSSSNLPAIQFHRSPRSFPVIDGDGNYPAFKFDNDISAIGSLYEIYETEESVRAKNRSMRFRFTFDDNRPNILFGWGIEFSSARKSRNRSA